MFDERIGTESDAIEHGRQGQVGECAETSGQRDQRLRQQDDQQGIDEPHRGEGARRLLGGDRVEPQLQLVLALRSTAVAKNNAPAMITTRGTSPRPRPVPQVPDPGVWASPERGWRRSANGSFSPSQRPSREVWGGW